MMRGQQLQYSRPSHPEIHRTRESIGGSRGGREGRTPPPGRPNSFDFMQFSGKFGVFTPPLEGSRPPSGKSWIRHWKVWDTVDKRAVHILLECFFIFLLCWD